jgi:putative ABC transport system ATP-binding protein
MINVSHLSKIYKMDTVQTIALNNVSFSIDKGEFVAIMGPSGSGKSTLMHILGALDTSTSGNYVLDGEDVGKLSKDKLAEIRNKKIGFVFQSFNLLPRTTALKNVALPMIYAGIPKKERLEKAKILLKEVGLEDRMTHTSSQLSGGQMQRVAIARALAMNPSIILADEPTGNVSSAQSDEIMRLFQSLQKQGHTIVMITHEPSVAAYAQRIIYVKDGKIEKEESNKKVRKE